jgi:hypothetical protein
MAVNRSYTIDVDAMLRYQERVNRQHAEIRQAAKSSTADVVIDMVKLNGVWMTPDDANKR